MRSQASKLGSSFGWLNTAQFLGALNDNIFKLLVIAFVIGLNGSASAGKVTAIAGAVFVVPFLIFSALAGWLADRFSKRDIVAVVKLAETVIMATALTAFAFRSPFMLYLTLFLMAAQSAFFSPSKYGIIPELVKRDQLTLANSFIEALTYLAIVAGAFLAPVTLRLTNKNYVFACCVCIAIAAAGFTASLRIRKTDPAGSENKKFSIFRTLSSLRRRTDLIQAVFAAAYFLMIGSFIQLNLVGYSMQRLGFDETQGGYMFLPGAVGIGLGAYLAGRLSARNIEFGLVPLGAIGITVSAAGLGLSRAGLYTSVSLVFLAGVSAGLFIVPVHSFIQLRSPRKRRGQVIAASNFLGWLGVLASAGIVYLLSEVLNLSAATGFTVLSLMTLVLAIAAFILLPDFFVRFIVSVITRICYRVRAFGIENLPSEGGSLLVCNHCSWADPLVLSAVQQRRIRFIMDRDFYNKWFLKPLCKLMKVIPISSRDSPREIVRSLKKARAALDDGFTVCIFAEGAMTRTGMMHSFKTGLEFIARTSKTRIVPVYIGGTWKSIFSYYYGRPLSTRPKRFFRRIGIYFGEPMDANSKAWQVREKVVELSCDYFKDLKESRLSLAEHFIKTARRNRLRPCISDPSGRKLNYGRTLAEAIALSGEIAGRTKGQEKVGILLPPSVGAVLANIAVTMLGKVTVNLNYSVSEQARNSAISQCNIKTVITSRKFIEKTKILSWSADFIFIEELISRIGLWSRIKAVLKAVFVPGIFLVKKLKSDEKDAATIIFSSGSSGKPKGVMLSHRNIYCNIEAMRSVFRLYKPDNLCSILPFFHSFGFTCSLWLPIISGVSASYAANPLDCDMVGNLARQNKSTVLFAAPTFLVSYARRIEREDFATIRAVVAGAEKLRKSVADTFEERFGIRPLEGYGATELSPVVSLNLPSVEAGGVFQVGTKQGTVGHPIPGVAVKIIDAETGSVAPQGQTGLLMIKGPNVMLGYLNRIEQTGNVLNDGWYNTGDIASIDEDGFLTIADRLSRFSKIGGEMVPHLALEEIFLQGLETDEQLVAVTSVPSDKRAEELVVLYLERAGDADKLHDIICKSNLPNIFKPRRENYIRIDSMPALGSGKLDVLRLKKMAEKAVKK